MNKHNLTIPIAIFPLSIVEVGSHTYGFLHVECYGNADEGLIIGNFVSIANKVVFILGGMHQMNTITSYPLYSKFFNDNPKLDSLTKGRIYIEDEVWIGYGAIILSGVRIGKGAIIAAGSVVTKDVDPYTVVAGNPARLIRKRFDDELLADLGEFNLSFVPESFIKKNIGIMYKNLSMDVLKELKNLENG